MCPQCGRVPALRRRARILVVTLLLGVVLGVAGIVVGRDYVPDVRYRLGVMLIEGSGRSVDDVPPLATPTGTPVP